MTNAQKQFVIQQHTTPDGIHWDLMLEMDNCLWTWRLNTPPAEIKNDPISAERIHDHPLRFLTYEGPVQNNTGNVKIADLGPFQIIEQTETKVVVTLKGQTLFGAFSLCQMDEKGHWKLEKK